MWRIYMHACWLLVCSLVACSVHVQCRPSPANTQRCTTLSQRCNKVVPHEDVVATLWQRCKYIWNYAWYILIHKCAFKLIKHGQICYICFIKVKCLWRVEYYEYFDRNNKGYMGVPHPRLFQTSHPTIFDPLHPTSHYFLPSHPTSHNIIIP